MSLSSRNISLMAKGKMYMCRFADMPKVNADATADANPEA